jgi:hypothetical protein
LQILLALGGPCAAVVLTATFLSKNPDVVFLATDPITATFSGQEQAIQQIIVLNRGQAPAQNIIVQIRGQILEYQLQKATQFDQAQANQIASNLELSYAKLQPSAGFVVVIKSPAPGISTEKLAVQSDSGKAANFRYAIQSSNPINPNSVTIACSGFLVGGFVGWIIVGLAARNVQSATRYGGGRRRNINLARVHRVRSGEISVFSESPQIRQELGIPARHIHLAKG